MNIHEYQGKEIFREYGIPVHDQEVATTPEAARAAAERMGGPVVVKAQVLVGGRGKAGGVKLAKTPEDAERKAKEILGLDIKGNIVEKILVTPASDILREYYVSITVNRNTDDLVLMTSGPHPDRVTSQVGKGAPLETALPCGLKLDRGRKIDHPLGRTVPLRRQRPVRVAEGDPAKGKVLDEALPVRVALQLQEDFGPGGNHT